MTTLHIAGGLYKELCVWPAWDQLYGSGGRAAAAVAGHVSRVIFSTYATPDVRLAFEKYARTYGFEFDAHPSELLISFSYVHALSNPVISPAIGLIHRNSMAIPVDAESVLRFGLMEGDAKVVAERCVYDPQSSFQPEPFEQNGSIAQELAVVGNRSEVCSLGRDGNPKRAAQNLIDGGAAVVIVKAGGDGALVLSKHTAVQVQPYYSERVFPIGSGDVFAAMFAARWACHGDEPVRAAELASRSVASYVESMALPVPTIGALESHGRHEVVSSSKRVYLAGPFFDMGQRWLVEETRRCLQDVGLSVFSPVHDVGRGSAEEVVPEDIKAIEECDVVFAILDGLDAGTIFEVGYARALDKPVFVLANAVEPENLKMLAGTNCMVYEDLVTAVHHLAWR